MHFFLLPRFAVKMSHVLASPLSSPVDLDPLLCAVPRPQSAFFFHCLNSHTGVRPGSEAGWPAGGLVDPLSASFFAAGRPSERGGSIPSEARHLAINFYTPPPATNRAVPECHLALLLAWILFGSGRDFIFSHLNCVRI